MTNRQTLKKKLWKQRKLKFLKFKSIENANLEKLRTLNNLSICQDSSPKEGRLNLLSTFGRLQIRDHNFWMICMDRTEELLNLF